MAQDELLSLFPTPVLIAQYPLPFEKELEFIRNLPCRRENKGGDAGNVIHYNRQSEDTFVLDKPELGNIKAFIESKIHKFVTEIMSSDNQLVITQSWINKSGKGESTYKIQLRQGVDGFNKTRYNNKVFNILVTLGMKTTSLWWER